MNFNNFTIKAQEAIQKAQEIAGAKYKGEFEERLKSVVKEVISAKG